MPCMTQTSTNPLRAPHTPPISIRRPPRHHHSAPKPISHPRSHPASPNPAEPNQGQPYVDVDAQDPGNPPSPPPPGPGAPPPHTGHHPRPRPPPSNPPRQGPDHSPGLVPPTRGLDQAQGQSPPGPDHPRQRPPRGHRRPCTLASPQTHPGPARPDPPHRVGPGPDTRHRHQRHTSRDHTPTTAPRGEGPPSGPEPPGAVGTGHGTNPRHRPLRRRPPHPRRRPPSCTYRVAVSAGFGGGFPVLRLFVARRVLVCVLCVCGGSVGVGVSSVCVGACVGACGGLFPWRGVAAGVSVGGGVAAVWAVPRHSWQRCLRVFPRHSWLGCAAGADGCSSPLLAEGPGCGPLPLLVGVRRRRWCVVVCPSGLRSCLRFPATPGWGPPAAAVAVCVGWGGGFSWCVCLWRGGCARGVCAGVCVVCSWWCRCGCVFRVCWCVCVCARVCGWGRLGLAAGVGVGVVFAVCRGWSLATPGGDS